MPVSKKPGDIAYSGSVAKQGEMVALVTGTGGDTYFGRTAKLVQTAGARLPFPEGRPANRRLPDLPERGAGGRARAGAVGTWRSHLTLVQFALILTVASIPVALPAVLSVTMAVGALALSKMKAIVTRLESIEEMAGIDILCSDKTGTLTQNKLTLGDPRDFRGPDPQELILYGALASKEEDQDPIDLAVLGGTEGQRGRYKATPGSNLYHSIPFTKRRRARSRDSENRTFKVTKGAPQVIMGLCGLDPGTSAKAPESGG